MTFGHRPLVHTDSVAARAGPPVGGFGHLHEGRMHASRVRVAQQLNYLDDSALHPFHITPRIACPGGGSALIP